MRLLQELQDLQASEDSIFRQQLLREDISRLQKLQRLASECDNATDFRKAGSRIGWTQNDMMTHLVAPSLNALLNAVYRYCQQEPSDELESMVETAWLEFSKQRNEKLIKCL